MPDKTSRNIVGLICFVVVSVTIVGYFVGLQAPMSSVTTSSQVDVALLERGQIPSGNVIPATHYTEIPEATRVRTAGWRTSLTELKSQNDPLAKVESSPEQKTVALEVRDENRAFNGAPPTIPHPADQTSSEACLVCHGMGVKTKTLRIPPMSHQFLANCTQCHVENRPRHMTPTLFRENTFTGLPAPIAGPRAFPGAPPQIPHSTWMRSDCMSCHGVSGLPGIRTTQPWRKSCQQCHAPSSQLDQTLLVSEPAFLAPPETESFPAE